MLQARRWVPVIAALAFFGFAMEVGLAAGSETPVAGKAYREGPLDQTSAAPSLEWPRHAEEFMGLGVLAAILYGFRASGLARNAAPRAGVSPRDPRMS